MLKEDKLLQENELINLISTKETFEETLKLCQICEDNENSLLYLNNINKSLDFTESKFEFFSYEFKIIDIKKLSSFLLSSLNENFPNNKLNSNQIQDKLNEMFQKVTLCNNREYNDLFILLANRLMSLFLYSDKKQPQSNITKERIEIMVKVVFKMLYYDEIITFKLNFINQEYKAIHREKCNLDLKLRNDLDSLINKLDSLINKEKENKKHQFKMKNESIYNNKSNLLEQFDILESKLQSMIKLKGELDLEMALQKEKYYDKIELLDQEINKLEEINTQFNLQIENYFKEYERKRDEINEEIFKNKKIVSDYYHIIREITSGLKAHNSEKYLNQSNTIPFKKGNNYYPDLQLEELCNEINNKIRHSSLKKIDNLNNDVNLNKAVTIKEKKTRNKSSKKDKCIEKRHRTVERNDNLDTEKHDKDFNKEKKNISSNRNQSKSLEKYNTININLKSYNDKGKNLYLKQNKQSTVKFSPNKTISSYCLNDRQTQNYKPGRNCSKSQKTNVQKPNIKINRRNSSEQRNNQLRSYSKTTNNIKNDYNFNTIPINIENTKEDNIYNLNTNIDKTTYNLDKENIFLNNLNNNYKQVIVEKSNDVYRYDNSYHTHNLKKNNKKSANSKNEVTTKSKLNLLNTAENKETIKSTCTSKIKSFSKDNSLKTFETIDEKLVKSKNNKFKFHVKFKFELCSPEEFQFLEKIKVVLEGSFVFKRINFLNNLEQTEFNPIIDTNPVNCGFIKFFVFADKTLTKLNFEKLTEPSIKSDINISSIQTVLVTNNMKNIVNYQQLVNKINKKGMDINEYLGCIKNIEEIEVDDNFLINEELRKKSVDVRNYVLYLILNNGIRLELILSSYDDFKHWLNALTSIVKHKNKLSLISNKIEQENNIYF